MKILICTASTGGGHKRAAQALTEYFQKNSDYEVRIVDGLELGGRIYNNLVCEGYSVLVKKTPRLYGRIYKDSDKHSALNSLTNNINNSRGKHLLPTIEEFEPDVIISCHAFITTMLGGLKSDGKISAKIIALVTDFKSHYTYIADGIDHYIVSSMEMVDDFKRKYNIDRTRVHPYGIPVLERFSQSVDKKTVKRTLGLEENVRTALFMAGSFGVSEVFDFYREIADKAVDCQFIVITGNNEKLFHKFEKIARSNTKLLMFVSNVEDYMHAADIIITKPGGLTVSESLQCELPMAIYSAYPGQEKDNAIYLKENGVAILLDKNPGDAIRNLISNEGLLSKMRENCRKIRSNNSSQKILELIESSD